MGMVATVRRLSARNTGCMTHIDDRREPVLGGDIGAQIASPIAPSRVPSILGAEQPVLEAQTLIDRLGLGNAIAALRIKLAFPAQVFTLAGRPLIDGYAEFVQMLPVSGSGRLAFPGGQLHRAFATALRALDRRRGQILPRGAAPEVIGAQAHRWTYAVFIAALLRDLHHVNKGIRVWMEIGTGTTRAWSPTAGSMRSCGAMSYRIETLAPGVLSDEVDTAMALRLYERCVPALIQDWLGEDQELMAELRACLSGHADPSGVISELVAWDAARHSSAHAPVVSPAPREPAATAVASASAPAASTVLTVDPPEFLEAVRPEESALARQFMAWLSRGVIGGALPVNTSGAVVHVVAEGLLLASPRIFREFAKQQVAGPEATADVAKRVQREVLREGWHLRGERGVNILCYEQSRSGRGTTRFNGIVIREPQRFIQPLPAVDSTLVRVVDGMGVSG